LTRLISYIPVSSVRSVMSIENGNHTLPKLHRSDISGHHLDTAVSHGAPMELVPLLAMIWL
jgi:hypothetical protein